MSTDQSHAESEQDRHRQHEAVGPQSSPVGETAGELSGGWEQAAGVLAHTAPGSRGNGPARVAAVQRMQQTQGNRATRQALQRQAAIAVQRDLPAVPDVTLTTPALLQPADPAARYHLGGDQHLHLDPQIQAMIQTGVQQHAAPAVVVPALSSLRLGALPAVQTPAGGLGGPAPAAPAPAVAPGAGPAPSHPGSTGDMMDAIAADPAVNRLVTTLQTRMTDQLLRDWHRLRTGEQIATVSVATAIVVPALIAALANPQTRSLLLGQINGRILPVPGVPWLHAEVNLGADNLMFGLHADVGRLLPQGWGFGPNDPTAIGGPPTPEPFVPGQRMVQRTAAGGAPVAVQRDPPTTAPAPVPTAAGPAPAPGVAAPTTAAPGAIPADLQTFRDHGPYPASASGQTIVPTTGMGGFNAHYDPVGMGLTITVNVAMTFVDGMAISGTTVTAADTSLAGTATAINTAIARIPAGPKRDAALAKVRTDWQWTGGGADPRITTFMSGYRSNVQSAWSSAGTGIAFQSSHPGWDAQLANVNVVVNTTNSSAPAGAGAAAAPAGPTPTHTQARIFKTPDGNSDFGAAVGPGTAASGTDQTLDLGSGQITAQSRLLHQSVSFANDSATLDNGGKAFLRQFIISFQAPAGGTGTSLDITGHASTTGGGSTAGDAHNQQLSENRSQAVADFLRTEVVEGQTLRNATARIQSTTGVGSTGADASADSRRVDIDVAGGQSQNIAGHEFGHMIGLDDEYATTPQRDAAGNPVTDANGDTITRGLINGTGGDVGDPTATNGPAVAQGMPGSVSENTDNIMSLGSTVRPQHYTTFMQAIRTLTSSAEWRVK